MHIIDLELNHFNFFCPVTGERILGAEEEANLDAPSVMGFWHDEFINEPTINDPDFQKAWGEFNEKFNIEEDFEYPWDALNEFLERYPTNNWLVYKLTHSGMACGPVSNTVWFVIDMQTVTEEEQTEQELEKATYYKLVIQEENQSVIDFQKYIEIHQSIKQAAIFIVDFDEVSAQLSDVDCQLIKAGRIGVWGLGFDEEEFDDQNIESGVLILNIDKQKCKSLARALEINDFYWYEQANMLYVESVNLYDHVRMAF